MEQTQAYGGMLELLTLTAAAAGQKTPAKAQSKDGEASDFRKLMDQTTKGEEAAPAVAGQQPQTQREEPRTEEEPAQTDPFAQQRQMELAAALTMQAPAAHEVMTIAPEAATEAPAVEAVQLAEAAAVQQEAPELAAEAPEAAQQAAPIEALPQERTEAPEEAPAEPVQLQREAPRQTEAPAERPIHRTERREEPLPTQEEEDETVVMDRPQQSEPVFHQADATYVKVSEAAPAEEAREDQPAEKQVEIGLIQALESGESKIRLNLTPENLGSVQVEITRRADGALHVVLTAQKATTQTLLERSAAGLQAMVADRSQQQVTVQVERREDAQSYDGRSGNPGQNGQEQSRQGNSRRGQSESQDFLQQLRLGLTPAEPA